MQSPSQMRNLIESIAEGYDTSQEDHMRRLDRLAKLWSAFKKEVQDEMDWVEGPNSGDNTGSHMDLDQLQSSFEDIDDIIEMFASGDDSLDPYAPQSHDKPGAWQRSGGGNMGRG